jgi:hypothetical protein
MPKNVAEEIVHRYFRRSFLSLWSYANPLGRDRGKELCDTLVVFDPDVVIVSVKASDLREDGDPETNADRWRRRTIDGSIRQIVGAERWVRGAPRVIRSDGTPGLPFPSPRRIHRVAAGRRRRVSIESRDYGDGFVHVLDELSLAALIEGCDTVTDLVGYLAAREELSASGTEIAFDGGEEDLLAVYLHRDRRSARIARARASSRHRVARVL